MSEVEAQKVPLFVEIIGEPETGKTHLACLFPKPALFDTTPSGEAYKIVKKLYPNEWKRRYFRIRDFADFEKQLAIVKNQPDFFKTVIVDTSVDMRSLGGQAHLKELQKEKPRKALMPEEWGPVNDMVNEFILKVTDKMGMNLVFTAQMQDEYEKRAKTGRRIRKGIPSMNFQAALRLYLQIQQKVGADMHYIPDEYERICTVIKNRFRNKTDKEEWMPKLKEDISWAGIKKLTNLEAGEVVE